MFLPEYFVLLKYTQNWENITILEQKILNVRGTSFQRERLTIATSIQFNLIV